MDLIHPPIWIPLSQWARKIGISRVWALLLSRRGQVRVGDAIAARKVAGIWFVREDARYIKHPPGPPKGFRAFKRARMPHPSTLPKCDQGENDAKSARFPQSPNDTVNPY